MKLTIYRVLSFLLIPVAVLFGLFSILLLTASFQNPPLLLVVFILAGISIYTFTSFNFLVKGIDGKRYLGRSAKEWIKVNAIVSAVFALIMIVDIMIAFTQPEKINELIQQQRAAMPADVSISNIQFENFFRALLYFFFIYSLALATHIVLSFVFLKRYNYLFLEKKED